MRFVILSFAINDTTSQNDISFFSRNLQGFQNLEGFALNIFLNVYNSSEYHLYAPLPNLLFLQTYYFDKLINYFLENTYGCRTYFLKPIISINLLTIFERILAGAKIFWII
ncbi:MAG: hypothetical protein DRR19_25065 [Candidatus Parabeggiatoa sp. nov. 1]|nr:MAG: hypothetical protein DRR19_25065 [Gammaproteobacteria bacterium]